MDLIYDKQPRRDLSIHSHHPRIMKIFGFAFTGFLVSLYLVYGHYHVSSSCDINPSFSCSLVNTSIYSEIFGVPVAVFGVLWNIIAMAGAWKILAGEKPLIFLYALLLWLGVGTAFVFYMIYAEYMIGVICPYCTLVHIIIGCMDYLILKIWLRLKTKPELVHLLQIQGYVIFVIVFHLLIIFMYPSSHLNLKFKSPQPTTIIVEKMDTQQNISPSSQINSIPPKQDVIVDKEKEEKMKGEEENVQQPQENEQPTENEEGKTEAEIEWDGKESTYLSALAKCMTRKGVQMFGSDYCGVCMRQKQYFGEAFSNIVYTDCSKSSNTRKCELRQIKSYPSWLIINAQDEITVKMNSYAEAERLEGFSGCTLKTKKRSL